MRGSRLPARSVSIVEHRETRLAKHLLSEAEGEQLYRGFAKFIDVGFPSPATSWQWTLGSKGYIGALAVTDGLTVVSEPKVPVANLAQMLGEVFDLPMDTFPLLSQCETMIGLYEQLVRFLCDEAVRLLRQGLHHKYGIERGRRSVLRGRLDIEKAMRGFGETRLPCRWDERTTDNIENKIILAALHRVLRSGLCSAPTTATVRSLYREYGGAATLVGLSGAECDAVAYSRLTARYKRAHVLSRLFLDASAPIAQHGAEWSVPFLLHMPTLFERYVARSVERVLAAEGAGFRVETQHRKSVGEQRAVTFAIDLVISDAKGRAVCVLDTKYKRDVTPNAADLAQVGYYAVLKGCTDAVLVYPTKVASWRGSSGHVQTRAVGFDVSEPLERATVRFIADLKLQIGLESHSIAP